MVGKNAAGSVGQMWAFSEVVQAVQQQTVYHLSTNTIPAKCTAQAFAQRIVCCYTINGLSQPHHLY